MGVEKGVRGSGVGTDETQSLGEEGDLLDFGRVARVGEVEFREELGKHLAVVVWMGVKRESGACQ